MAPGDRLIRLRHGTTLQRAKSILHNGPDPDFREPNGPRAEGFSTARIQPSYPLGSPDDVAENKAKLFSNEGGPAIIELDVPESIVQKADLVDEVRFEPGFGLEELLAVWPSLPKRIVTP